MINFLTTFTATLAVVCLSPLAGTLAAVTLIGLALVRAKGV